MSRYFPSKIEKRWQVKWLKGKVYEPDFFHTKRSAKDKTRHGWPFYNLMMFPYPSAEGLHIGGVRTFTGVDIYGRYKRMQGYDVFEPMGLDGFGLNAENYALKIGAHPMRLAKRTEKNFYRQLGMIGNGFAWDERLETYDPAYYRWTQWIFVQMFKHGLAYRKKQAVNWCPSCKTVLADEQVVGGNCERCGSVVIKKELEQWFFRITKYADRLLKNLEKIDWSENVKIAQRNWIGKSEGALIKFKVKSSKFNIGSQNEKVSKNNEPIEIFTTRSDTLFGATYLVLAPEHGLVESLKSEISNIKEVEEYQRKTSLVAEADRIAEGKEKTGVRVKGVTAINPATNEEIPVFVADYVLGGVGTGAIMAVPAHDQRDFDFARKFNVPMKMVVCPHYPAATCPILDRAYTGEGHLVDSGKFNGMPSQEAKWAIVKAVGGRRKINFRLRDWLVSRQRYWGAPIPMIFCESCCGARRGEQKEMPGWYSVPEKDLPVILPFIKNFRPTGTDKSPLASVGKFYKVRCPTCKSWARRETDVCDNFLDSAWYYLRYPSVKDKKHPWRAEITKKWFPVDMYIGGAEHSVLHLLYVRFLAYVFHDLKLVSFTEPFKKFRSHGLITKDGTKMSKSRGNVVNPDEYISAYGADAMRMYLAFMAPLDQGGDFRDAGIAGITRFLNRVWKLASEKRKAKSERQQHEIQNNELQKVIHRTIKKVSEDIENLQYNTAISALMVLVNEFEAHINAVTRDDIAIFLKLLAPFAPHITEELWQEHFIGAYLNINSLAIPDPRSSRGQAFTIGNPGSTILQINLDSRFRGNDRKRGKINFEIGYRDNKLKVKNFRSIHHEKWPSYNKKFLNEDTREFAIQINGKLRDTFTAPADIKEQEAIRLTLAREKVKFFLAGREPKKVIFVHGRLVNVVV